MVLILLSQKITLFKSFTLLFPYCCCLLQKDCRQSKNGLKIGHIFFMHKCPSSDCQIHTYFKIHIMREKQSLLAVRFRNDFATKSRVCISFNAKTTIISSNKMKTILQHLMKKCIVIGGSYYLHTLYFCPVILHFQTCA